MKNLFNKILLAGLLMLGFSCTKQEYTQEMSSTYPISGDWAINATLDGQDQGSFYIKIYNTSFGKDSIWIDDNGNFGPILAKAPVDMKNNTFSINMTPNKPMKDSVNITNGKVIGKDSIYFEVEFSGKYSGDVYHFAGHRKTSYEEYMGLK